MQSFVVSTSDVPEAVRFAFWRDAVCEIGVPGERDRPPETPFEGRLVATIGGGFTRFRFRSGKYRVLRQSREAASRCGDDRVWLYREIGAGSVHEDHGCEFVTRTGDVIIGDPVLPGATEAFDSYDHEIWHFPRALLDPHLPAAAHPRMLHLSVREGVTDILVAYLASFSEQLHLLGDAEAAMVADNFCRLIAIACGSHAETHSQAMRAARLEEVKRYIALHLSDQGLTPARTAAAARICVRQLHALFEPTGTSFGEYVLQRRLEECRAALTAAAGAKRSVTDIAFAWGFNSLPTFYRTFRRAFGASPSEIRSAADAARDQSLAREG